MTKKIDYRKYIKPAVSQWEWDTVNVNRITVTKFNDYYVVTIHTEHELIGIDFSQSYLDAYYNLGKGVSKLNTYIKRLVDAKTKHMVEKKTRNWQIQNQGIEQNWSKFHNPSRYG